MISRTDIEDMTDAQDEAPERIWASENDRNGGYIWGDWDTEPKTDEVEYVRADLARPSQAGDESVARLVAALREIEQISAKQYLGTLYTEDAVGLEMALDDMVDVARAALAAMDTPKGGGDE